MKTITIKNKTYNILDTYPKCCEYHEKGIAILMDQNGQMFQVELDALGQIVSSTLLNFELA